MQQESDLASRIRALVDARMKDDELAGRVRALVIGRLDSREAELDARVRALVTQVSSVNAVARRLGVPREVVARVVAGLPIRRGSRLAIERGLALWLGSPEADDGR